MVGTGDSCADNHFMRAFARETWLPTALFTAASLPLCLSNRGCSPALALGPALTALIIVPAIWHWYVPGPGQHRIRRAALAGASASYLIVTLPYVVVSVQFSLTHSWSQLELGALVVGMMDLVMIVGGLLVAAPIGAVLGIVISRVQRSHPQSPPGLFEGTAKTRQHALTAVMIAILLSPVLAVLAMVCSGNLLAPLSRRYSIGCPFALGAIWLVSIPIAAVLGARRPEATLAFRRVPIPAVGLLAVAMVVGSMHGGRWAVCSGMSSLVLVPLIWPAAMDRNHRSLTQRGVAAGASIGFLAQLVPAVASTSLFLLLRAAAPKAGSGTADSTRPAVLFFLLTATLAAVVGATIGAVLARNLAGAGPSTTPKLRPVRS
jgi:hypothetical protein